MNDRHGSSTGRLLIRQPFKRRLPTVCVAVAALVFAACGGGPTEPDPGVDGSGPFVTQSRSVSGFNGVSLSGVATLIIEQTGVESLAITAQENILPLLGSDVVGDLLVLGPRPGVNIGRGRIVYELTVRDLNEVSASGVSKVEARGIDTPFLDVDLAGVTNMTSTGTADEQRIDIAGVASYQAGALRSRVVRINVAGVSSATLRVSERLDVNVGFLSTVKYFGNPVVNKTGLGTVRRLGD